MDFRLISNLLTLCMIKFNSASTTWKVSKYGVFSGPYFPVFGLKTSYLSIFSLNAGKYGPEKLRVWTHFIQCSKHWILLTSAEQILILSESPCDICLIYIWVKCHNFIGFMSFHVNRFSIDQMGQNIQEWIKWNLWKAAFKKFEVIWSLSGDHITSNFLMAHSKARDNFWQLEAL